jgi:Tol biopolymer transport system component
MSDYKDVLERMGERVPMPEPAFDRLSDRRERRHRNRKISAGILGVIVTAALVLVLSHARDPLRGVPGGEPTGRISNGLIAYTVPHDVQSAHAGIYLADGVNPPLLAVDAEGASVSCPAFSPDGTQLAFVRQASAGAATLSVVDVGSGGVAPGSERSFGTTINSPCPRWAPGGDRLLYLDREGLASVALLGGASPVRIWSVDPTTIGDFAWSPDGALVAAALRFDAYVRVMSARDGSLVTQAQAMAHGEVAWSPTGDRIAIGQAAIDQRAPVWLIDPRNGDRQELTASGRGFEGYGAPSWSPDGMSLALLDHRGNDTGIVIVRPADGTSYRLSLSGVAAGSDQAAGLWGAVRWSPDGQRILVASGCSVYSMPADGSGVPALVSSVDVDPQACLQPPGMDWQQALG